MALLIGRMEGGQSCPVEHSCCKHRRHGHLTSLVWELLGLRLSGFQPMVTASS